MIFEGLYMKLISNKSDAKLKEIILLHNITKHFILLGEETDLNFNSYIQPIKEFRDSHDHMLRALKSILFDGNKDEAYVEKQLSKSLEHEYRAFFDVADWFSIICRSAAQEAMKDKAYCVDKIIAQYDKYLEYAQFLNGISVDIAQMREAKDVGGDIAKTVNDYKELLVKLHEATVYIQNAALTVNTETTM